MGLVFWLTLYSSFGFLLLPWFGEFAGLSIFMVLFSFFSLYGARWLRGMVFKSKSPSFGYTFYETSELGGLYILGEAGGRVSIVSGQEESQLLSKPERSKLNDMRLFYLKRSELVLLTVNVCFLCLPYYIFTLIPFIGERFLLKAYLFLFAPVVHFLKGPTSAQTKKNLLKMTKELEIQGDFSSIISKALILKEAQLKSALRFLITPLSLSLLLGNFSHGE